MNRQPIRVMAPEMALKIAAGEVVERPASAVKELVDNALDAGARRIHIELREGGLKLIRVTDDGIGLRADELSLAFQSHATSKISTWDDLDSLNTLGFRGEALPSIAAVSRVELQSRIEGEDLGARITLEFGKIAYQEQAGCRTGTRVSVMDLFSNVPARRKFVRSLRAETGRVNAVVCEYALARPDVAFLLTVDDRESFSSPGTGSLADAFAGVYGASVLANMHALSGRQHDVGVDGLISAPSMSRATRSSIHLSVNGRPVANRSLVFALEEAYSGFLMTGRHPIAVAHLTVDADEVDPNIHPSKNEVRFAREREVHGALHRCAMNTLFDLRLRESETNRSESFLESGPPESVPLALEPDSPEPTTAQPSLMPELPVMRVFGQTNSAFIIAEGPTGLYMIDQHAAHERILFDRFDSASEARQPLSQPLLDPIPVDLEPDQMAALEENRSLLDGLGLVLEPFGNSACLVRAIPAAAGRESPSEMATEVLDELKGVPEPSAARERALAAMACKAAVKAGQVLTVEEMRDLVMQLERTARPNTCPHGRPTMIHVSHTQLEREFGRR